MFYNAPFYFFAFAALAIAVAASILVIFRGFGFLVAACVSDKYPATWFQLPFHLAASVLFPGYAFKSLSINPGGDSVNTDIVLTIGSLPGIILMVPAIYVMFHFALAPMIGILAFMVSLLLGLLIPQLDLLTRKAPWRLSWIASVICVAFIATGSLTAGFNTVKPRPNAVAYLLDSYSGESSWFSAGYQQDSWTSQFFTTEPEYSSVGELFPIKKRNGFPVMIGDAPGVELEIPELKLLNDETGDDVRYLQLGLNSPRGASVIMLDVEPYEIVQAVIMNGKRIVSPESEQELWSLTYYAVPEDGFEVTLELIPSQSIYC